MTDYVQGDTRLTFIIQDSIMVTSTGEAVVVLDDYSISFDAPPLNNDDLLYAAGWSICTNSSLAFGNSAVFYGCVRGSRIFYYTQEPASGDCYSYNLQTILLNGG